MGVTFATTTQSAFAAKNGGNDCNTVTAQINKQTASQSGFDNDADKSATNLICTHPFDTCLEPEEYENCCGNLIM